MLTSVNYTQSFEALGLQNLILNSIGRLDAPLRSNHNVNLANIGTSSQQFFQNDFTEEACASGNHHVLAAVELLYIQLSFLHF